VSVTNHATSHTHRGGERPEPPSSTSTRSP
jgi:hypothetical protein